MVERIDGITTTKCQRSSCKGNIEYDDERPHGFCTLCGRPPKRAYTRVEPVPVEKTAKPVKEAQKVLDKKNCESMKYELLVAEYKGYRQAILDVFGGERHGGT